MVKLGYGDEIKYDDAWVYIAASKLDTPCHCIMSTHFQICEFEPSGVLMQPGSCLSKCIKLTINLDPEHLTMDQLIAHAVP